MSKGKIMMAVFNNGLGDSRVFREASSLGKAGYEVSVYALHDPGLPMIEQHETFVIKRLPTITRQWRKVPMVVKAAELAFRLFVAALRERPFVYHAHDLEPLPLLFLVAKLTGRPVVYDSHELHTERNGMSPRMKWLNTRLEKFLVPRVDRVLMSDGRSRAQHLANICGIDPAQIIDIGNFPIVETVSAAHVTIQQRMGVSDTTKVMVYVGAIGRGRGLPNAVRALAGLPDWHLALLGRTQTRGLEDDLRGLARELHVEDRVHFLGLVPPTEVAGAIRGATVGLSLIENTCLSYYYSRPTKLFEYMLSGIPVVASDFPEIRRCLLEGPLGPSGMVIDPASSEALQEALQRLTSDRQLAGSLGKTGLESCLRHYNWCHEEVKLRDVYSQLEPDCR